MYHNLLWIHFLSLLSLCVTSSSPFYSFNRTSAVTVSAVQTILLPDNPGSDVNTLLGTSLTAHTAVNTFPGNHISLLLPAGFSERKVKALYGLF